MAYAAFLFIVLSAVGFFNYHNLVSDQATKALFFLSVLFAGAVAWVKGDAPRNKGQVPMGGWWMLMAGLFVSIFMASLYHRQSLKVSVITTLPMLFAYGTFIIFYRLDLSIDKVMKGYFVLAIISSFVYFCNAATVPNNIFGKPIIDINETRGIVRISVVFIEVFPLLIFYCINRWFLDKKRKWFMIAAFLMLMIVLSVVRQVILFTVALSVFFILRRVSWKIKALICAGCLGIVVFILPMIPIYKTMLELSQEQVEENEDEENIRITAWRFYTYDNQTGALTPIFGNGMPSFGNSVWGISFDSETDENGCFAADVGWAGFYWYHGIFAVAGLIWMMAVALRRRKAEDMQFLNYGIVMYFLLAFASGPIIYFFQVVNLMLLLAMACYCPQSAVAPAEPTLAASNNCPDKLPPSFSENSEVSENSDSRRPLLPRFPQLRKR